MKFDRFLESKTIWILWAALGISVLSKLLVIPFLGAVSFPNSDEHLYIEMAKSIYFDKDFISNAFGNLKLYNEVLFPLLLSPAYIFYSPGKIVTIFRIIGTLVMSSAIFPAYKLGFFVLNDKKQALLISVIAILIPEMTYALSVTQEVIYYPLFLFAIYLIYRKISINTGNTIFLGFVLLLLWTCKAVGMTVFVGYIAYLFFELAFIKKFKNSKDIVFQIGILIIVVFGLREFLSLLIQYVNTGSFEFAQDFYTRIALDRLGAAQNSFLSDFANGSLYYLFYTAIAFVIFPILAPLNNLKIYGIADRKFIVFLYLVFITTVFTVVALVYMDEGGAAREIQRVHYRYFFPLLIPFIIMVLKMDYSCLKFDILGIVGTSFLVIYYVLFNPKFMIGSIIDSKSLLLLDYINKNIINGPKILTLCIVIFLIFMGLIFYRKYDGINFKKFLIGIILLVFTINHVYATYKTYRYYTVEINGIERKTEYSYLSNLVNSIPGTPILMYSYGIWWFDLLFSTQSKKDFIRMELINNILEYSYDPIFNPNYLITPKNLFLHSKIKGVNYVNTNLKLFDVYQLKQNNNGKIKFDYSLQNIYSDNWLMDDAVLLISGENRNNQVEVVLELKTSEFAGHIVAILKDSVGNITSIQVNPNGTKVKLIVEKRPDEKYFSLKFDSEDFFIPKDMPDIFGENDDARKLTYSINRIIIK